MSKGPVLGEKVLLGVRPVRVHVTSASCLLVKEEQEQLSVL